MRDDDGGAGWQQHAELLEQECAREELARAARLAARLGGHPPEGAAGMERALLAYAGIPPERNPNQFNLNI